MASPLYQGSMKMHILEKYLGVTLIKSTLLVLLILVGLEIFILLAAQLDTIGKGSYTFWQAVIYVLLILPQQTYLLFPMAGLLGMLFGLSLLASHSELIIMRAAGVSPLQIMRYMFVSGLILIIMMTLIGEAIAPFAKQLAEKRKLVSTSTGEVLQTRGGLWLRQGDNFYYIKTIYSAHHIGSVSRYAFNNNRQLLNASFAEEGRYQHGIWQMRNIRQSNITTDKITTITQSAAEWYLALNPHLLTISLSQPDEMTLRQLAEFIRYQKESHLVTSTFKITFWQRLLQPLATLVMMFLAIPFIFGPLRSVTTSLRLMLGVIIGFAFYITNQLFPPLSQVLNFPPYLAVILPILLFAGVGLFFLKQVR